MKMKGVICILAILSIMMVEYEATAADRSVVLYHDACQKAAEKLAKSLANDKDVPESQRIAVIKIEDDKGDWLRENLLIALDKQSVNVMGMMEHAEMDSVLGAHDIQIKYEGHYDEDSLVRLGKLLAPRALFVAKVQPIVREKNKVELILYGKLLVCPAHLVSIQFTTFGRLSLVGVLRLTTSGLSPVTLISTLFWEDQCPKKRVYVYTTFMKR